MILTPKEIEELTKEELEAFVEVNRQVGERTMYGIRKETVPEGEYAILTWSNGAGRWMVSGWLYRDRKTGDTVDLDANMLLVKYPQQQVEKFIAYLDPLPLYGLSTEARMRGEASPQATLEWALKQLGRC